jgi:hypothetical protein
MLQADMKWCARSSNMAFIRVLFKRKTFQLLMASLFDETDQLHFLAAEHWRETIQGASTKSGAGIE